MRMSRSLLAAVVIAAAALPAPASAMPTRDHGAPAQLTAAQMLTQAHVQRELREHNPVGPPLAPADHRSFPSIEVVAAVALIGALVATRRVRSPGRAAAARR
jgi:hypothetical protein